MRYIPRHFKAYELLPKDLYEKFGENGLYLIDDRILWTLDSLRDHFNTPIIINNWKSDGEFSQRGYRNDNDVGAKFSSHRFGRACDFDICGITSEEFRELVRKEKLTEQLKYITRIEDLKLWNHIDVMGLPRESNESIEFFTV
jgi:hypothetical protein